MNKSKSLYKFMKQIIQKQSTNPNSYFISIPFKMLFGWIDVINLFAMLTTGLNAIPIVTLEYYNIGLKYATSLEEITSCQEQVTA